jgi:hypothetical protein
MPTPVQTCHSQLTALTELSGTVFAHQLQCVEYEVEDEEAGAWLPAARLVRNLTRLRRLALYNFMEHTTHLWPCVAGRLCDLAPCAGTLEELALFVTWGGAAGALPPVQFMRVHSLHLSATANDAYPASLALAFPICRTAIFGDTYQGASNILPPLGALPGLEGRLESLTLTGRNLQGRVSDLAACSGLRSLQLQMIGGLWLTEEKLYALTQDRVEALVDCLPNLVQIHVCNFPYAAIFFPNEYCRSAAGLVAAAARNGRTLVALVSTFDVMWPQPCLLPRIGSLTFPPC